MLQYQTIIEFLNETFSVTGLLAKREISDRIEKVEKKMQEDNAVSMSELGYLDDLHEAATVKASQLISDENTRFILINKLSKVCSMLLFALYEIGFYFIDN